MVRLHNSDRNSFRSLFAFPWNVLGASVLVALLLRALAIQVFLIPSASMQPTLRTGDRILVEKLSKYSRGIQRGDVVVFDGADVWTAPSASDDFVKRVVAVGGDHVQCCTADGRLVVNGTAIDEPYLLEQGRTRPFNVLVQPNRLWVLGDNRAQSADSSAFRGVPGGGSVPASSVIGRVVAVIWPPSRAGILSAPNEGTR